LLSAGTGMLAVIPALSASAGYDPANPALVIDKVRGAAT
jgi:hypothetical protein